MNDAFAFEASPWELYLDKVKRGSSLSAARMLTLLEGESEDAVEDAFAQLEELRVCPWIGELPTVELAGDAEKRQQLEMKLYRSGSLLTGLPEEDPLRLYLEEIAALPAQGDEELLAAELAENNRRGADDSGLCTRLVNLSLARVVELASEYMQHGVLLLDLIQEGSMGLWKAILSYTGQDMFHNERDWWIRFCMTKAVIFQARESGIGSKLRRDLEQYRAVDRRLLTDLGRNATLEEIAQQMGITADKAMMYEDMLRSAQLMEKAHAPKPEQTPEDEQAVEDTAYFQSRQRILEMLSTLTAEEAQVLSLRFGLEGGQPCTPQQVGAKLGLTPDEVVSLEAAALAKLRKEQG
jgi:RNA polymerase primary sigma factor